MTIPPWLRPHVISFLADRKEVKHKQLAARTGRKDHQVDYLLHTKGKLDDAEFEELLAAIPARPAHAAIATVLLLGLEGLDQEGELTPGERDQLELGALDAWQACREASYEVVHRSRAEPPRDEYPKPEDVEPARWLAQEQVEILKEDEPDERLAVVLANPEYQHWAMVEAAAHEAERAASRKLEEAQAWAELAVAVAGEVKGPPGWLLRVRGYAAWAEPNLLRVRGELDEADVGLVEAERLWEAGTDPDRILDPARLLDIKGSLRRAQRRFREALDALDGAFAVSRFPGRVLVKKAFTQEVMGAYEGAIATLRRAEPLVERQGDAQLSYQRRFNLAVVYTHVGAFAAASELAEQVLAAVVALGDEIFLNRLAWLRGRIAAGLGRREEALELLQLAAQDFAARGMFYDVALALLEIAALLLDEGRAAEVKVLAQGLAKVFKSKKVHPEALASLRIFQEAVEQETATAELARRVLRFLFRARHDQGLRFES
jgi:tetratricopeptide (TPR) repeat protein